MADISKLIAVLSERNPENSVRRAGGFHTLAQWGSEVDDVFQPGIIAPSDFPTDTFDQYRKVYWRNQTGETLLGVKIYGFNVKSTNIISMALERGQGGDVILDGSESIKNYRTLPGTFVDYHFTELFTDDAQLAGNAGNIPHGSGQGIWLRQRVVTGKTPDPSDQFMTGAIFSETG